MRKRRKLIWQLFYSYLIITLLALLVLIVTVVGLLKDFYLENTRENLEARARLVVEQVDDYRPEARERIDAVCDRLGALSRTRLTVILPDGLVIGDSEKDPKTMDNHGDRPEIRAAYQGKVGMKTRYSYTLKKEMMYVAIGVFQAGELKGVVRASMPVPQIASVLGKLYRQIFASGIIAAVLAVLASLFISHRINRNLGEISVGARRFADGDLNYRFPHFDAEEIGALAETMNTMASQLSERIQTVTSQRNELEAVLSNMVEAVVVLDAEGHIIRINRAALQLFNLTSSQSENRDIFQVVRSAELHRFVKNAMSNIGSTEADIVFHDNTDRFLQAHGTKILDQKGKFICLLIVLNDVTRLKRLENIRRDFVANVSHELKTPITSIKGFVETLRDGAIDDAEKSREFMSIVAKHADRLNAIIEDLLSLSRIEQNVEKEQIQLESGLIKPVIKSAFLICNDKAKEKNIELFLECPDTTRASINPAILEQAVINLIDNAIKYSDEGSSIKVEVAKNDEAVAIRVIDTGCGIPEEHLPRIFERFYRVDKARSRKMGGTGLGLAIVKHIVQAHHGRIDVESEVGKGSSFVIYLPE